MGKYNKTKYEENLSITNTKFMITNKRTAVLT